MSIRRSGESPWRFRLCPDLYSLPEAALAHEVKLHGGFAVDKRPGQGELYYGMPGVGLLRIGADLTTQSRLDLPPNLVDVNFHSTKLGEFEGASCLFLPADAHASIVVATLEGQVVHVFSQPEYAEYLGGSQTFRPTDTAQVGDTLWVADGYGANYIHAAHLPTRRWQGRFGGRTTDPTAVGHFGTAHGMNVAPHHHHQLTIADRPHARLAVVDARDGAWQAAYSLPAGSKPCGIDYVQHRGRWLAVVGSLDDPLLGRPAPIYILDGESYALLATVRPKQDLGVERADHLHNVVWHSHNGRLFLVCQSWNPGHYFVLEME